MHCLKPLLLLGLTASAGAQEYTLTADSQRHDEVPKGTLIQRSWGSKIFPGTTRDYWVYVPSQYDGSKPVPLMIFQDGAEYVREDGAWRAPVVLDNLINKKELPPMIAVFLNPGVLQPPNANGMSRYNRSFEYDAVSDRYARFLIEEIIPEVRKNYNLSGDPDDRGLCGANSGATASFAAAWLRPDQFHRVVSFSGNYSELRGGNEFAGLIRKSEPKPLRIFVQDDRDERNTEGGSRFIGNQDFYESLKDSGYDTVFVAGTAGSSSRSSNNLPAALRWLWKEYPKPVTHLSVGERHFTAAILNPGHGWELVSSGHSWTEGPAVDKEGNLFFSDIPNNRIHKVTPDGKATVFKEDSGGTNGLMIGPDGRLYACQSRRKRIVAYTMDGAEAVIAEGMDSNDIVVTAKGGMYFTEPRTKTVWFIDEKGARRAAHQGIEFPNGIIMSPDQSLLMVADWRGKWVWSFQVQSDGSLTNGQPFYRLKTGDESSFAADPHWGWTAPEIGPDGLTMDTEGYLYVATSLGIQVCDQLGRVAAIIDKPQSGLISNVTFGGQDMQTLYVTAGDKVFMRHLRRKGVSSWTVLAAPKPPL